MKNALRRQIKWALAALPAETADAKSRQACENLRRLEAFARAETVMLYLPIPHEVDVIPLAQAAWRAGKTVVVPKVNWTHRHMIPVVCESVEDEMAHGRYGLRHPAKGQALPAQELDLIVLPALGFDRLGNRLGRGGGFYDRFLDRPDVTAEPVGIAFAEQLVDELPVHDHDQQVDLLATDLEVVHCRELREGVPAGSPSRANPSGQDSSPPQR